MIVKSHRKLIELLTLHNSSWRGFRVGGGGGRSEPADSALKVRRSTQLLGSPQHRQKGSGCFGPHGRGGGGGRRGGLKLLLQEGKELQEGQAPEEEKTVNCVR